MMNRKRFGKVNSQKGSATVEALIAFTGFLFVIFTILGTVNLCRVQMLVSSAVDTAAKELSQYAYFYQMSGLQKLDEKVTGQADVGKENINEIIGTVDNLYSTLGNAVDRTVEEATNLSEVTQKGELELQDIESVIMNMDTEGKNIGTSINSMTSALEKVGDDPLLYMRSLVAIAGGEASEYAKKAIAVPLAKLFVQKHFGSSRAEANETLEALGIEGGLDSMNFNMSTVFSAAAPQDIQIVVYYKVKLLQLLDWEVLEVNLCKQAVCRAWLGGDDVQEYVKVETTAAAETEGSTEDGETDGQEPSTEETEESTEETEETTNEEVVDIEGSFWYEEDWYKKDAAFDELLESETGIVRDSLFSMVYGRDEYNVAYGRVYCTTAEDARGLVYNIYQTSLESIKELETQYLETDGALGYEPGTTVRYVCYIFVPDNISDQELAAIEAKAQADHLGILTDASEETGLNVSPSFKFVKGGGNYDYGSGG